MKFVGLDLGGVNSLACVRDDAGTEAFQGSAHPERPSCVLLPLVRKEKVLGGDEALRNERGSGVVWPPLAMATPDGWSRTTPPAQNGRVMLATVWQQLNTGDQWMDPQWQPSDGLPAINKPAPAECLTAEVRSVLKRAHCDFATAQVVLAIPNQLPEESQESLLGRLPAGARLVWRSVAAAMSWAEMGAGPNSDSKHLAVLDLGLHGLEISVFEFRQQEMEGRTFRVPVRRLNRLRFANTDALLADSPAPFSGLRPDLARLEPHLSKVSDAVGGEVEWLLCGPLAEPFLALLQWRFPSSSWSAPDAKAIARGACLFAWRLTHGWPTYFDVLPSLELFTLTEEHEPKWLPLIPTDCEVSGGSPFQRVIPRRIFIEKDTTRVASWLQRSGETEFRKLSTDLPVQAAQNAWVDLNVSARSAGGFARVRITPSPGQFDVFGSGQNVMLNWQSMERVVRGPKQRWPVEVRYGWPRCGKLFGYRPYFQEFLRAAEDLEAAINHRVCEKRLAILEELKRLVRRNVAPNLVGVGEAGGDASPVNLLLCFGTASPGEFLERGFSDPARPLMVTQAHHEQATRIAGTLWGRLKQLSARQRANTDEVSALLYVTARMGDYVPPGFKKHVALNFSNEAPRDLVFAVGRVLGALAHGTKLFRVISAKETLNSNWLSMLVYVLYQRPDVMCDVSREHILAASRLGLAQLERQVCLGKTARLFMNSLRCLALLLRVRRHAQARDFLMQATCHREETDVAERIKAALSKARLLRLRAAARLLLDRTEEWLNHTASTDEMPPIAPPDEEEDAEE